MRGAVMYGPGDVRVEERETPRIIEPTDAIIRVSAACVCGSDLWPYRGVEDLPWPAAMGHGTRVMEEKGRSVSLLRCSPWKSDTSRHSASPGTRSPDESGGLEVPS